MVVMVLQHTEVTKVQVTVVNSGIMVDKELGSEVTTLLVMGPLGLMGADPRHSFGSFGSENMNL